jgi:hypothetical protein
MKILKSGPLLLGLLLFANLAVEGAKLVPPAHAATKNHYKIVPYTEANREELLNKYADEGWELSGIDTKFGGFILEHE